MGVYNKFLDVVSIPNIRSYDHERGVRYSRVGQQIAEGAAESIYLGARGIKEKD